MSPADPESAATRLLQLEERYSHVQKLLADLSDVLYHQQRTLDRLETRVQRLEQQLAELLPELPHERPPHY